MAPRQRLLFCAWMSMTALFGCTESHDVDGPAGVAGGGDTPSGGSGGSGARGGSGTRAGSGGSGNTGTTVSCDKECSGSAFLGTPCCTADNKCGFDLSALGFGEGCAEMNAPGKANASCPGMNLGGFLPLEGCCTPDGKCGLLDTFAGLGCTTAGSAEGMTCQP
ncbi:MAG TPA: hypothetical protein VFN67_06680 [Polyangiales bacterium]|nr:hypothetical protein [Polyangiales bacterium]